MIKDCRHSTSTKNVHVRARVDGQDLIEGPGLDCLLERKALDYSEIE